MIINNNEILKKILIHMQYDTKKTLSENKMFINENDDQQTIYENNCLKGNTTLNSVFVPKGILPSGEHWENLWTEIDGEYFQSSNVEDQILFYKKGKSKWSACLAIRGACNLYKLYVDYPELGDNIEKYSAKNACNQKLPSAEGSIDSYLKYFYIPELKSSKHQKTISFLDESYGDLSTSDAPKTKNKEQIKDFNKKPQINQTSKEKETLKNNPDAYLMYPKDYAASKGMKEWELYKEMFCCPKSGSNVTRCNQNIAKAIKDGWDKTKEIPPQLSFCDNNTLSDTSPFGTDNIEGGLNVSGYGNEDFVVQDQDVPGLENAQFDGNFYSWFSNNFIYPQSAIDNNIEGVVNVTFTINTNGEISNVDGKGVTTTNKLLINAAISLIKKMPNWIPAKKDGKNIISRITLPIEFSLFDYNIY